MDVSKYNKGEMAMVKLSAAGSVPLTCERCQKVRPNSKYSVGSNEAQVIVERENVVFGIGLKGYLCPYCCEEWCQIVSAFWGVDLAAEMDKRIEETKMDKEADDNDD